jgi:hypothetical protein
MTLYSIPPHEPESFRLLLPNDEIAVIPYRDLAPATLADLKRWLVGAGTEALEHARQLRLYADARKRSQ